MSKHFTWKRIGNGTANPIKQDAGQLNYNDLQQLLDTLCEGNWLQSRIEERVSSEARAVESVQQFTHLYPPDKYERILQCIRDVLVELGFKDNQALDWLAEHLFADIYIGRPEIDPAILT